MASPNLSEIITTTLRNRSGQLADNVTETTALLSRLNERGNVKPFSGGRTIVEELFYAENSTYQRYSGYEVLNITPSDVISAAEFDIKQCAVAVSISGLEQLQNAGKEAVIDLLESRIENAEQTFMNNLSTDVYSDGTASSSKQIGGLQLLVEDTGSSSTSTVGGISRSTYSFWQNFSYDATTDGGAAASAANIQKYMNHTYLSVARNRDVPDLIVADNNYFKLYWESLQAIQRITNEKMAQAGFMNLKFMNADVVFDGGVGGQCPSNHMYFLNTKYIRLRPHRDRNMEQIGGVRESVNQDASVRLIGWAGNMTLRAAKYQGVLKD
ncbi:MAG: phage major capsid protein [Gemmatimonadaceae bacterium]|nr:phage major capsid protein [Gemmatimonadaceae bacterium]